MTHKGYNFSSPLPTYSSEQYKYVYNKAAHIFGTWSTHGMLLISSTWPWAMSPSLHTPTSPQSPVLLPLLPKPGVKSAQSNRTSQCCFLQSLPLTRAMHLYHFTGLPSLSSAGMGVTSHVSLPVLARSRVYAHIPVANHHNLACTRLYALQH